MDRPGPYNRTASIAVYARKDQEHDRHRGSGIIGQEEVAIEESGIGQSYGCHVVSSFVRETLVRSPLLSSKEEHKGPSGPKHMTLRLFKRNVYFGGIHLHPAALGSATFRHRSRDSGNACTRKPILWQHEGRERLYW